MTIGERKWDPISAVQGDSAVPDVTSVTVPDGPDALKSSNYACRYGFYCKYEGQISNNLSEDFLLKIHIFERIGFLD